tara:strand:+ start:141 stop:1622 length:1482 start_codon:yes stop_codon:yes gene_type:complete
MVQKHHSLDYAGDYILDSIKIVSFDGKPVDIKSMVQEFNIYESIYSSTLTGSLVIADALNLINKMPLQGTETLEFKLFTPGAGNSKQGVIDATSETGHPFHIYKLSNRKQPSEGVLSYVLHFCSRELIRSVRTRVSQAYDGPLHEAAIKIFMDQEYLDSRKKLYVEPTRNKDKVVIPNLHPLDAISALADKSLSGNSKGAGYFFYETTKGFHFHSWESMVSISGEQPRPVAGRFDYFVRKATDGQTEEKDKVIQDLEAVQKYEFINNYDTMAHQGLGTYGHKVITHNIYDKSYSAYNWRYHNWYSEFKHADDTGHGDHDKYPIAKVPVDYDGEKTVSDFPDSMVTLQPTTQYLHGEQTGSFGVDVALDGLTHSVRNMQSNAMINGIKVLLTIHGQSYLEAGDVIWFGLRSVEPDKGKGFVDPKYAGRYVITKIRHRVTFDEYKMVLECVKDSVFTSYGSGDYVPRPSKEKGQIINQYNLDESILGRQMGHHNR